MLEYILPLIIFPWILILFIGLVDFEKKEGRILGKKIALWGSIIEWGYTWILWAKKNSILSQPEGGRIMENISLSWKGKELGLWLGIDGLSFWFIMLTTLLITISILVDYKKDELLYKEYLILLQIILFMILTSLLVLNLLWFYIFFEAMLIPMFLLIGVWGGRKEKVKAAYYFIFYTILGSIIMLASIIYLYLSFGSLDLFSLLNSPSLPLDLQIFLLLGFILSFAIKIPLFPFHIWLPYAHVEAPITGSVLLAGILIKLGGYGLIRFAFPLCSEGCLYLSPVLIILGILGVVYASLVTFRQVDIKRIIAYSSVAHMGVLIIGIFSCSLNGWIGAVLLSLAHGLVASGLFILANVLYSRYHTRQLRYYRGLVLVYPLLGLSFFLLSLGNVGIPLTLNFIGEFYCFLSLFKISPLSCLLGCFGIILSVTYTFLLFNRLFFGSLSPYLKLSSDLLRLEFIYLSPLVILPFFLGLFPSILTDEIHSSLFFFLHDVL